MNSAHPDVRRRPDGSPPPGYHRGDPAGEVLWLHRSLPSSEGGFDSRRPLLPSKRPPRARGYKAGGGLAEKRNPQSRFSARGSYPARLRPHPLKSTADERSHPARTFCPGSVGPPAGRRIIEDHGEWRSLVAHPAGGRAVAGSNPVSPIDRYSETGTDSQVLAGTDSGLFPGDSGAKRPSLLGTLLAPIVVGPATNPPRQRDPTRHAAKPSA